MVDPRVVARAEHTLSRRDIDPDALKVLYRLRQFDYIAYLVGGSVRDLLLGRHPKDFDIGTSAHPYQVKKLFRNCWIIGRRFRLAHVKFGNKTVEVATFRRQVAAGEEVVDQGVPAPDPDAPGGELLIHRDNTFGTPEEDAFRRDFTINALFYDIATFSIIDYVGGLDDLRAGVVRAIGDPDVRFREDPVRMMRAVALAARLDFAIDPPVVDAIRRHRHEIALASPPRVMEEYYKILRSGAAERTFRSLLEVGLLEPISGELHEGADERFWQSLARLDAYRRRFASIPETLINPVLLGSLVLPLNFSLLRPRGAAADSDRPEALRLGSLPLGRRDVERLRQILAMQRRLLDVNATPRVQRALAHRSVFRDALTWLDVHSGAPDIVAHWLEVANEIPAQPQAPGETNAPAEFPRVRRRRRRRRRYRPAPEQ